MKTAILAAALAAITLAPPAASAAEARECFYIRNVDNYSVSDDEMTVYLLVNGTRFFRLDLARQCTGLSFNQHIALNSVAGSSSVCNAIDIDLRARMSPGAPATLCQVDTLHAMTPEEVAALPKKLKP